MASIHTCFSHSGTVAINSALGGIPHDFHHHFQNVHFGSGGYCDWFFKTRLHDRYPKVWDKVLAKKEYAFLLSSRKFGGFSPEYLQQSSNENNANTKKET